MACLVLPVSILRRRSSAVGYQPLTKEPELGDLITVVVGKEKREFLVEALVLEENPFRNSFSLMSEKLLTSMLKILRRTTSTWKLQCRCNNNSATATTIEVTTMKTAARADGDEDMRGDGDSGDERLFANKNSMLYLGKTA
ncbi:hypothetical protein QYF36_026228 [Acer negundo]|nr:hypothetical protein QYF36_026228 [Acer negundo]